MADIDHTTKLFNTAIISTKMVSSSTSYTSKLSDLVQTAAFKFILKAIKDHAQASKISEEKAAEELILTFREIDSLWNEFILQEGLSRLKTQINN